MEKTVYLDGARSTYLNNQVLAEMMPVLSSNYACASSQHFLGRESRELVEKARRRVAKGINARSSEIIFTSGATEANNLAILGLARANSDKGKHIIVSKIEQPSILLACKRLEKEGYKVTYLPVDKFGMVSLSALMHEIKKDTILVSIAIANYQVGTIQNLNAIARTVKEKDIIFHCDATYAIGNININVRDLNIDAMTMSSSKIYGPEAVGALYVKNGVEIESVMVGDGQENGKRAGEQNVANIVGFGKAVELATQDVTINAQKLRSLREYFTKQVKEKIENAHLLGHPHQRLSNMVTFAFEFVDADALTNLLDQAGICVSSLSDCSNSRNEVSGVLKAMGLDKTLIKSAVRFSLVKNVSKEDLDYVVDELVKSVKKLREISSLHISVVDKED